MSRLSGAAWITIALVTIAWGAGAQTAGKTPPKTATKTTTKAATKTSSKTTTKPNAASEGAVATVGGVPISRAQLDQRVREAEESYRSRSNAPVPAQYGPMLRRQALEGLIRENLLVLEARRRGMTVTQNQAEELLKKDPFFQKDGMFDEAKYLAVRSTQPDQFQRAVAELQRTYPARRLKEELERQNHPDESALRADLERRLSTVTIDFLALRWVAFSSNSPEPTERQVIEYYGSHREQFQVPEQTQVTLVNVKQPPPATGDTPAELQAWEGRMRARAESLATAARKGAKLEDLAPSFGPIQTAALVANQLPPSWRPGAKASQSLSSAPLGTVLDAVPGKSGYVVTRVDARTPGHTAPLREVAPSIRATLRAQLVKDAEERDLTAIYQSVRDSLRGPAYRVRYAVADTGAWQVAEPSAADLDRYYRGHSADYSFYDPKTSSVSSRPLPEVRAEVRARLLSERRQSAARTAAEQLLAVWKAGKRDSKLERAMTAVHEVGPVRVAAQVDTGLAGSALSDSLASRYGLAANMIPFDRGWVVYQTFDLVPDYTPTQEQARAELLARRVPLQDVQEGAGARRLYDQDPRRFSAPRSVRFTRVMINPPDVLKLSVSRDEVVQYYNSHLDDYGASELVHARHILISPSDASPQADAKARAKAEDLMRRVNAGERVEDLARKYSDDDATRDKGGDVGVFNRGMMLDEFERAAFTMKPGDVRGPVKTEVGYHIIECIEHVPAEVTPLKYAYANVASDVARDLAQRVAKARADSLRRAARTPGRALRAAEAMQMTVFHNELAVGSQTNTPYLKDYFGRIERLKPGEFDPEVQEYRGMGYAVTWVDSVAPPRPPSWEEARDQALDLYRRETNRQRVASKRAEFDSLLKSGWSFDSLCTLYGGPERHGPSGPGNALERLSGRELLDSLAFGTSRSAPVLEPGRVTSWIEFPAGMALLKLVARAGPDPVELANRVSSESRVGLERNLRSAYDKLRQRFPVEILDRELRQVDLPALPDS